MAGTMEVRQALLDNAVTPPTPAVGQTALFVNTSKQLSTIDDTGLVKPMVDTSQLYGFRNKLFNCNFTAPINQRGAGSRSANITAYNYDRWYLDTAGTSLYQGIEGLNLLPNTTYTLTWSGTGVTAGVYEGTAISAANAIAGATFTAITNGGTFTTSASIPTTNVWVKFSGTIANLNFPQFVQGASSAFEQRPYGLELALCQRYTRPLGEIVGQAISASAAVFKIATGIQMRVAPTNTGGVYSVWNAAATVVIAGSVSVNGMVGDVVRLDATGITGSPLGAGNATTLMPPAGSLLVAEL
jgi:hypothetical protein